MLLSTGRLFRSAGGGGSPAVYPLDGLSATGAWSMSRDLLTSFVGGTRYTTATGVSSLRDQTGNSRHFEQASGGVQPAVSTTGPNSRTCAAFDGTDDFLQNLANNSTMFANNSGLIIVSCLIDAISSNSTTPTSDVAICADPGGYTGLALKSTTPAAIAYNFDGSYDTATVAIATATALVMTWRHEGGNLYVSKNGGTEVSVASGNTGDLAYKMWLGRGFGGYADINIIEAATFQTVPATWAAVVADFMSHSGAV
jgi:hypothetical protein